jgi:hypothetical protein
LIEPALVAARPGEAHGGVQFPELPPVIQSSKSAAILNNMVAKHVAVSERDKIAGMAQIHSSSSAAEESQGLASE